MVTQYQRRPSLPPAYSDLPPRAPASVTSAPPAPAPPRAASVTSARSHTRRHRHARSHHGGSGGASAQNEFPVFSQTGDVEIIVTSSSGRKENRYLLHRLILAQCSGVFEAGTRSEWSGSQAGAGGLPSINEDESGTAGSSSRGSSGERRPSLDQAARTRWRYVLDWQHAGEDDAPMLVQKEDETPSIFGGGSGDRNARPSERPHPPVSNERFFRSMSNFAAMDLNDRPQTITSITEPGDEVLKDYDNLFRTMYQYPPALDSVNIANAYTECKALLNLADMYDALEIVGSRVDHHLLRFGARLLKQIAKYPPSYLRLGYLARSKLIFTEALIHVVGQWPDAQPMLRGQLDQSVMDLILDKADEVCELQEKAEYKLWRLSLTTSKGERVNPNNDYLSWLAISLFRQWFADNTTPPPPPSTSTSQRDPNRSNGNHVASQRTTVSTAVQPSGPAVPGPNPSSFSRTYILLGSPSSYLTASELKRFLKTTQPDLYTTSNLRRFEQRVDDVKMLAKEAVKPLMRNHLELDLASFGGQGGLGYLTCVGLGEGEEPWG